MYTYTYILKSAARADFEVYMFIHLSICIHIFETLRYICLYIWVYVYICICIYICMYMYTCVCIYICIYIYVYIIRAYVYSYIHTYVYLCMYVCKYRGFPAPHQGSYHELQAASALRKPDCRRKCRKRPVYIAKEAYWAFLSALRKRQRPTNKPECGTLRLRAREECMRTCQKRPLFAWQKRPIERLVVPCPLLREVRAAHWMWEVRGGEGGNTLL